MKSNGANILIFFIFEWFVVVREVSASVFCLYDGINYISEGKYNIHHNTWFLCRTSFVLPPIMKVFLGLFDNHYTTNIL